MLKFKGFIQGKTRYNCQYREKRPKREDVLTDFEKEEQDELGKGYGYPE